jgi:hypothetical protein
VVKYGAALSGQVILFHQVTVPDVMVKRKTSLYTLPLGTLETVNVVLPLTVLVKYVPRLQSILEAEIAFV